MFTRVKKRGEKGEGREERRGDFFALLSLFITFLFCLSFVCSTIVVVVVVDVTFYESVRGLRTNTKYMGEKISARPAATRSVAARSSMSCTLVVPVGASFMYSSARTILRACVSWCA